MEGNTLDKLKALSEGLDNEQANTLIIEIEKDIKQFKQHQKQLFELAANYGKNYPGITDLRYSWTNVINSIRGYLAYRHKNALDDAATFREKSLTDINRLLAFNANNSKAPLTFEQEDSLANIIQMRETFFKRFDKLVDIHVCYCPRRHR